MFQTSSVKKIFYYFAEAILLKKLPDPNYIQIYSNLEQNQKFGTKKDKIELLRKRLKMFQERKGLSISSFCKEINFDSNVFSKIINGHKKTIDAYLIGQIITRYENTDARWFFMEGAEMTRKEVAQADLASKNEERIISLVKKVEELLNEIMSLKSTVSKLSDKDKDT